MLATVRGFRILIDMIIISLYGLWYVEQKVIQNADAKYTLFGISNLYAKCINGGKRELFPSSLMRSYVLDIISVNCNLSTQKNMETWASCDGSSCSHHNRSCDESSTEGERQKRCQRVNQHDDVVSLN